MVGLLGLFFLSGRSFSPEKPSTSVLGKNNEAAKSLRSLATSAQPLSAAPPAPLGPAASSSLGSDEPSCWAKLNSELGDQSFRPTHLENLVGDWYLSEDDRTRAERPSSTEGKFILALARAGLLEGKRIEPDDEEALTLLDEVSEDDPGNSAPFLYAAMIEGRRGNHERSAELFAQAEKTDRFDSYMTSVAKSLFGQVRTSSDLIQAYGLWSTLAIPDLIALKNDLLNRGGKLFAHQLMKSGLGDDSMVADVEWFPLEYAIGKSLLNALEPNNAHPSYRQILKLKNEKSSVSAEQVHSELQSKCEASVLDPMVELLRSRLP